MEEEVFLKPKQYAFKVDGEEKKKSKGIKKNVTKTLKLENYKDCLLKNKVYRKEQFMIQAKRHQIYTIKQNKVALNEDDKEEFKRHILENKINTL
jgi:hypothetical protein